MGKKDKKGAKINNAEDEEVMGVEEGGELRGAKGRSAGGGGASGRAGEGAQSGGEEAKERWREALRTKTRLSGEGG